VLELTRAAFTILEEVVPGGSFYGQRFVCTRGKSRRSPMLVEPVGFDPKFALPALVRSDICGALAHLWGLPPFDENLDAWRAIASGCIQSDAHYRLGQ
jgi:hypothetical protein